MPAPLLLDQGEEPLDVVIAAVEVPGGGDRGSIAANIAPGAVSSQKIVRTPGQPAYPTLASFR
jgi:hypothetical protein